MRENLSIIWLVSLITVAYLSNKYTGCQHRIPITYLILALSIYSVLVIQQWIPDNFLPVYRKWYVPIFIISIIILISLFFVTINSKLQIILFSLFITLLAISFNPLYRLSRANSVLLPCLITVILLFTILSVVAYYNLELINLKWSSMLFVSLLSLLLLRISFIWFSPSKNILKLASYVGIVLFSFYILYDTKLMVVRATQCDKPYNYVQNVVSLFLDFINLLSDTLSVSNLNRN